MNKPDSRNVNSIVGMHVLGAIYNTRLLCNIFTVTITTVTDRLPIAQ